MTLVGRIRTAKMAASIEERRSIYRLLNEDPKKREDFQLHRLNQVWRHTRDCVPFYKEIARQERLPLEFSNLSEFCTRIPVTTKAMLRDRISDFTDPSKSADFFRTTGGTTASPISMPAWKSDLELTGADPWLARGWYGINANSRLFLIWGHSHLLGRGWQGKINGLRREIKDRLLGYHRFSAYDLTTSRLQQAADELLRARPEYLVGYSVALDQFRMANEKRVEDLRRLKMKAVIATAESFPHPGAAQALSELFDAPVTMEYGAVETGLIGHMRPCGGYQVFWATYFVEAAATEDESGSAIRITSLYPRCTPLLRYEIGDVVLPNVGSPGSALGLTEFGSVQGRCNAYVMLKDGTKVHSEAFSHALREQRNVAQFQVIQEAGEIKIALVKRGDFTIVDAREIRRKLKRIHPTLAAIQIDLVDRLSTTISGKTPMVVVRS